MGCLVGEVENRAGIDCISHVACLEVEVRAGGAAGVAAECNGVTGLDVCVGLYEEFREVTVDCLKVVGVAEHDIVAVAAALEVGDTDAAVECGADSVADVHLEVNAFVLTAETAAVTVGRCDVAGCRHTEFRYVDFCCLRHGDACVAVHELAVPAFGIYVEFGLFFFVEELFEVFRSIFYRYACVALVGEQLSVLRLMPVGQTVVLCRGSECEEQCGCECYYCNFQQWAELNETERFIF